jgi:hypothetical protein
MYSFETVANVDSEGLVSMHFDELAPGE